MRRERRGQIDLYVRQLEDDLLSASVVASVAKIIIYGLRINSDELVREFGDWRNAKDRLKR